MLYCSNCAIEKDFPITIRRSRGNCEICLVVADCNDTPSKDLPMPKKTFENEDGEISEEREIGDNIKGEQPY